MAQLSFLADILTSLFERQGNKTSGSDDRGIEEMCLSLLDSEGEVSGITLAQAILQRFSILTMEQKAAFFGFLNSDLDVDLSSLEQAIAEYKASSKLTDYKKIASYAEPKRQELLRRLNQPPGATQALVNMRTDLLKLVKDSPELARTDIDFQHLLCAWFNRGFLMMQQISWDTPASVLEKIVKYEAVHAIKDWADLRRRLYPEDRRCFAFFHPSMPEEPLIFVEVALTCDVPNSIQHVLADQREQRSAQTTKVAVFYSISNCQKGLTGISFGNLLIKQVVAELQHNLPNLETFVTLSPIPGFVTWLEGNHEYADRDIILDGSADSEVIQAASIHYLLKAKNAKGAPMDPVARFHLGNGAQIYAVHGDADLSENGLRQSAGAMVNYQYDLKMIEQNHERFFLNKEVSTSPEF